MFPVQAMRKKKKKRKPSQRAHETCEADTAAPALDWTPGTADAFRQLRYTLPSTDGRQTPPDLILGAISSANIEAANSDQPTDYGATRADSPQLANGPNISPQLVTRPRGEFTAALEPETVAPAQEAANLPESSGLLEVQYRADQAELSSSAPTDDRGFPSLSEPFLANYALPSKQIVSAVMTDHTLSSVDLRSTTEVRPEHVKAPIISSEQQQQADEDIEDELCIQTMNTTTLRTVEQIQQSSGRVHVTPSPSVQVHGTDPVPIPFAASATADYGSTMQRYLFRVSHTAPAAYGLWSAFF